MLKKVSKALSRWKSPRKILLLLPILIILFKTSFFNYLSSAQNSMKFCSGRMKNNEYQIYFFHFCIFYQFSKLSDYDLLILIWITIDNLFYKMKMHKTLKYNAENLAFQKYCQIPMDFVWNEKWRKVSHRARRKTICL